MTMLVAALLMAPLARAQDAGQWLTRAAQAERTLNYTGTVVYQAGPRDRAA